MRESKSEKKIDERVKINLLPAVTVTCILDVPSCLTCVCFSYSHFLFTRTLLVCIYFILSSMQF